MIFTLLLTLIVGAHAVTIQALQPRPRQAGILFSLGSVISVPCVSDCAQSVEVVNLCQQNPTDQTLCTRLCRAGMYANIVSCLDCLVATGAQGIDAAEAQRAQSAVRVMCTELNFRTLPLPLVETGSTTVAPLTTLEFAAISVPTVYSRVRQGSSSFASAFSQSASPQSQTASHGSSSVSPSLAASPATSSSGARRRLAVSLGPRPLR